MNKILTEETLPQIITSLTKKKQSIVLAGGGFDILHQGHLTFLKAAKKEGDILIILLESDESLSKRKGEGRPINTQSHRASILAAIPAVDYILPLPRELSHAEYDSVVLQVKPAIIATTKGDPGRIHKERQADVIGATVRDVTERLPEYASTFLARTIPTYDR